MRCLSVECSVADWPLQWQHLPHRNKMAEDLMAMDMMDILDYMNSCDSGFCPPPLFDLPPPPPPPFMDTSTVPSCLGNCGNSLTSSQEEDNSVQHIIRNIIVITVSSLVIIISLLLAAVFIWR